MKKSLTIRLPKPIHESIVKEAEKRGIPQALLIERIYREWLFRNGGNADE